MLLRSLVFPWTLSFPAFNIKKFHSKFQQSLTTPLSPRVHRGGSEGGQRYIRNERKHSDRHLGVNFNSLGRKHPSVPRATGNRYDLPPRCTHQSLLSVQTSVHGLKRSFKKRRRMSLPTEVSRNTLSGTPFSVTKVFFDLPLLPPFRAHFFTRIETSDARVCVCVCCAYNRHNARRIMTFRLLCCPF